MTAPLAIISAGMVTGVGLSAPASCAAIRCGISNFKETRFVDRSGEAIIGSVVPIIEPWGGLGRLARMAALAVRECLDASPTPLKPEAPVPLILCIAEEDRPGRLPGLGGPLLFSVENEVGFKFHPESSVVAHGRIGGAVALYRAQKLIHERHHSHVIIAGVDSYLTRATLAALDERDRLLTAANSNGFIPGEAASAVLLGRPDEASAKELLCIGIGFATERAAIEAKEPLRGDGLTEAIKNALAAAGCEMHDLDYRVTDNSGEQYYFKEAELALCRTLRRHKEHFYIWHPADCIGEVGAAIGPAVLAVAKAATAKDYGYGPNILCHWGNDVGRRGAAILRHRQTPVV